MDISLGVPSGNEWGSVTGYGWLLYQKYVSFVRAYLSPHARRWLTSRNSDGRGENAYAKATLAVNADLSRGVRPGIVWMSVMISGMRSRYRGQD